MKPKDIGFEPNIEPSDEKKGTTWFLGIGINNYIEFPQLHNAVKDIDEIASILRENYDVNKFDYLKNEEVTLESLINKLDYLKQEINEDSNLLIYFSGHGHVDETSKRGFWIPYNAKKSEPGLYIRNGIISEYLNDIKAHHIVLISDACFSGSISTSKGTDIYQNLNEKKSRWVLCSGRADEKVYDGQPGENSPFAKALIDTLKHKVVDKMNISELGDIVVKESINVYKQYHVHITNPPTAYCGELPLNGSMRGGQYVFNKNNEDEKRWESAQKSNTIRAYQEYISTSKNGKYLDTAQNRIDILTATQKITSCKEDSDALYLILDYPNSIYNIKVQKRIKKIARKLNPKPLSVNIKPASWAPKMIYVEKGLLNRSTMNKNAPNLLGNISIFGYFISKFPIKYIEYKQFCQYIGKVEVGNEGKGLIHPVVNISWKDAIEYCEWLSAVTNKTYRLPLETEWLFAAKGGNLSKGFIYSGSNDLKEIGWFKDNAQYNTHPVGKKKPNELGLYDMCGNVWEMCEIYRPMYTDIQNTIIEEDVCVLRGGSWVRPAEHCQVSYSEKESIRFQGQDVGFRIVMEA